MVTLTVVSVLVCLFGAARVGNRSRRLPAPTPDPSEVGSYDLGDFYDATARALRSSASFQSAVWTSIEATGGSLRRTLSLARMRVEAGGDFIASLERAAAELGDPSLQRYADAAAICLPLGGPTAEVFDVLADSQRRDRDFERELAALAAPARLSARLIAVLPVAFLALSAAIDPGVLGALGAWPNGVLCTAAGLALDAIGFAWMHRTVEGGQW